MTDKRTKEIKIRLTDAEHAQLLERSQKARLAEWMREYCLSAAAKRPRISPPKVEPALLRQLAGIGNNLNQVARRLNELDVPSADQLAALVNLGGIERELAEIRKRYSLDDR